MFRKYFCLKQLVTLLGKLEVRLAGMKSSLTGGKLHEQNGYNSLILSVKCFGSQPEIWRHGKVWLPVDVRSDLVFIDDGMSTAALEQNSTKVQTSSESLQACLMTLPLTAR